MITRLTSFAKGNAVALTALFVAPGGTSYAAINLPGGSVGTKQLHNGAVTPVKLDSSLIGGSVRAWAYVSASGKLLAGHGFQRSVRFDPAPNDDYGLTLSDQEARGCAATASAVSQPGNAGGPAPGTAVAILALTPRPAGVLVSGYNTAGQPAPQTFVVDVLC